MTSCLGKAATKLIEDRMALNFKTVTAAFGCEEDHKQGSEMHDRAHRLGLRHRVFANVGMLEGSGGLSLACFNMLDL